MADKTVIVEIQYDTEAAITNLNKLTDSIAENEKEQVALKKAFKDGTITQEQYSQAIAENSQQLSKSKGARKDTIDLLKSEKGSVDQLKAQVKLLTKERDSLNTSTTQGKERAQVLNKQIQQLNATMKEAKNDTGKAGGAFSQLGKNLSSIPGPVGGVINGFIGMTKAALAFIATPIGAVIAAIGLSLKALMSYLKGSEEGQNKLNKIMMVFKTITGNLSDLVQKLGKTIFEAVSKPKEVVKSLGELIENQLINRFEAFGKIGRAVVKIFSKDWKEGIKDLANAGGQLVTGVEDPLDRIVEGAKKAIAGIKGIIDETKKEIDIAKNLADRQAALDLLQRSFLVEGEKLRAKVADLRLEAANKENKTVEQQIAILKEADAVEQKLLSTNIRIKEEKAAIKRAQNALSNSTKDDLNELAQLEADVFIAQRESFMKRKELTAQISGLEKQAALERKKEEDEAAKRRGKAIDELSEARAQEIIKQAKTLEQERDLLVRHLEEQTRIRLESEGLLAEEIELIQFEHKQKLSEIENGYQEKLIEQKRREVDNALAAFDEITQAAAEMGEARVTILGDSLAKIIALGEKEVQSNKDKFLTIGQAAQQLSGLIISNHEDETNSFNQQKEVQFAILEADYQRNLEAAGEDKEAKEALDKAYNESKSNLEREFVKRENELKRKQFKEDKAKALIDSAIATALAVAQALPNIPLSVTVGVIGGIQAGIIASKQPPVFTSDQVFAKGGVIGGEPHSRGGTKFFGTDGSAFEAERGEAMFVLKKDASAQIAALSAVNEAFGGRSFKDPGRTHLQDGGEVSRLNIEQEVDRALQRTPIFVQVRDILTGTTDFNNTKKAGVI